MKRFSTFNVALYARPQIVTDSSIVVNLIINIITYSLLLEYLNIEITKKVTALIYFFYFSGLLLEIELNKELLQGTKLLKEKSLKV